MSIAGKIIIGSIAALALVGYGYMRGSKVEDRRFDDLNEFEAIQIRERMKADLVSLGEKLAAAVDTIKAYEIGIETGRLEANIELLDEKLKDYDAKQAAQQTAE